MHVTELVATGQHTTQTNPDPNGEGRFGTTAKTFHALPSLAGMRMNEEDAHGRRRGDAEAIPQVD